MLFFVDQNCPCGFAVMVVGRNACPPLFFFKKIAGFAQREHEKKRERNKHTRLHGRKASSFFLAYVMSFSCILSVPLCATAKRHQKFQKKKKINLGMAANGGILCSCGAPRLVARGTCARAWTQRRRRSVSGAARVFSRAPKVLCSRSFFCLGYIARPACAQCVTSQTHTKHRIDSFGPLALLPSRGYQTFSFPLFLPASANSRRAHSRGAEEKSDATARALVLSPRPLFP